MFTYVLRSKSKKLYLHKDRVHSTLKLDNVAGFHDYYEAETYAMEHKLNFEPVLYSSIKEKK